MAARLADDADRGRSSGPAHRAARRARRRRRVRALGGRHRGGRDRPRDRPVRPAERPGVARTPRRSCWRRTARRERCRQPAPLVSEEGIAATPIRERSATRPVSVDGAVRQLLTPGGRARLPRHPRLPAAGPRRRGAAAGDSRCRVRDALGVATTLGFGPRFLHSTGQLHKGGPDTGVFLQLTADPSKDLPIPGWDESFGTLIAAQALGDLTALQRRGRRALRLHFARPATPAGPARGDGRRALIGLTSHAGAEDGRCRSRSADWDGWGPGWLAARRGAVTTWSPGTAPSRWRSSSPPRRRTRDA